VLDLPQIILKETRWDPALESDGLAELDNG